MCFCTEWREPAPLTSSIRAPRKPHRYFIPHSCDFTQEILSFELNICYLTEYAQRFLTQILTRPDLPAGCQLWTLRQQGAKRQQRRPIQTQLPARLDRRREAEAARGGEAVCSSVWSNYTLKAQRQIKHFAPAAYFFKEHWGGGKALAPHSRSSSETLLLRCIKRCHRPEKRIFRYTFTSMLLTSSWNVCTWTPRVFSGGFLGFFPLTAP